MALNSTFQMKKPTTLPIESIAESELLQRLPGIWSDNSPEMLGLAEDVLAHGIHEPLVVMETDHDGSDYPGYVFLIDGRHRLQAARLAGLTEVPVIYRPAEEAADIILSTLVHRRHYSKGALAYLSYPIVADKLKNATHGGARRSRPTESVLNTLDSVAASLGLSSDTLLQARGVHDMFRRSPSLKEEFEPRILSGEIGLGACLAGLRGKETTEGGRRSAPDYLGINAKGEICGLLPKSLVTMSNGFQTWGDLDAEARALFRQKFVELLDSAPPELLAGLKGGRKS